MANFITAQRHPAGIELPRTGGVRRVLSLWLSRRAGRRALANLDARLLADIGLTPEEAAAEVARRFWEA